MTIINIPEEHLQADERLQGPRGREVLESPLLNKGSAFTEDGAARAGPPRPAAAARLDAWRSSSRARTRTSSARTSELERYIFLGSLQDRNETLFYRLLQRHITEMMPIIYTPTVGAGCQQLQPHLPPAARAVHLLPAHRRHRRDPGATRLVSDPGVIVVTDGERILGLGDLGVGGMGIPDRQARALHAVRRASIPRRRCRSCSTSAPTTEALLRDPLYLGWRHARSRADEYDDFIDAFVRGVKRRVSRRAAPVGRLLQGQRRARCWSAIATSSARSTTTSRAPAPSRSAGLLAAMAGRRPSGCAISGSSSSARLVGHRHQRSNRRGDDRRRAVATARRVARIWLVDSQGLRARRAARRSRPSSGATPSRAIAIGGLGRRRRRIDLRDVVRHVHPTILIGVIGASRARSPRRSSARWPRRRAARSSSRCRIRPRRRGDPGGSDRLDRRPCAGRDRQPVSRRRGGGPATRSASATTPSSSPGRPRCRRQRRAPRHATACSWRRRGPLRTGRRRPTVRMRSIRASKRHARSRAASRSRWRWRRSAEASPPARAATRARGANRREDLAGPPISSLFVKVMSSVLVWHRNRSWRD